MDNFLINLAVIKVNWDQSDSDLLDNYMPLLGHAIKLCDNDIVNQQEIAEKLEQITEFRIPRGAMEILITRAAKRRFSYIARRGQVYVRNNKALEKVTFLETRSLVERNHNYLKSQFKKYCKENYDQEISDEDIEKYFFEILYEISPKLIETVFSSSATAAPGLFDADSLLSYRIFRFVEHTLTSDPVAYSAIESFVRGAMLTETFYYVDPRDIRAKMREIEVYFDTAFLLRILGYTEKTLGRPAVELHEMLRDMNVKLRCFRETYHEVHGILTAATAVARRPTALLPAIPGDAFDYFARIGASSSDLELELARLDQSLSRLGIKVVDHPAYTVELGVDEKKLNAFLDEELPTQKDKAREHDVNCLTAIHRIRGGQPQKYIESCRAIFITTNAALARASTKFFNEEHGVSDAPVCMTDHIFATLVWLKAVKKRPDLPKERLVADVFAATNPSDALWGKYLREVQKLKLKGGLTEEDFALLAHSLEARRSLMEITEGSEEVFSEGSVQDVLSRAKQRMLSETRGELEKASKIAIRLEQNVNRFIRGVGTAVQQCIYWAVIALMLVVLAVGLFLTTPSDFPPSDGIKGYIQATMIAPVAFLVLIVLSLANLLCGTTVSGLASSAALLGRRYFESVLASLLRGR